MLRAVSRRSMSSSLQVASTLQSAVGPVQEAAMHPVQCWRVRQARCYSLRGLQACHCSPLQ